LIMMAIVDVIEEITQDQQRVCTFAGTG